MYQNPTKGVEKFLSSINDLFAEDILLSIYPEIRKG